MQVIVDGVTFSKKEQMKIIKSRILEGIPGPPVPSKSLEPNSEWLELVYIA